MEATLKGMKFICGFNVCYVRFSKSVFKFIIILHMMSIGHSTEYFLGSLNMSKPKAGIWFVAKWDMVWGGHLKHFLQKSYTCFSNCTVQLNQVPHSQFFLIDPWHKVDLISNQITSDGCTVVAPGDTLRPGCFSHSVISSVQVLIGRQTRDPPLPGHVHNLPDTVLHLCLRMPDLALSDPWSWQRDMSWS